jgi:uncharacterized protein
MPLVYFVDSWFFIARLSPRDAHHRNALRLTPLISSTQLVTHHAVLTEVLTYFADDGARARALAAGAVRDAFVDLRVVAIDHELFRRALALYEDRPDKGYSLVDCLSMVVMRDENLAHVLTNDHHFRQEGFTVVSDAS